jgi:hypothetical protein
VDNQTESQHVPVPGAEDVLAPIARAIGIEPQTAEAPRVVMETFPIDRNPTVDTARPEPERPNTIYWRQLDIVNMDNLRTIPITIIGSGSVGSFTALSLAKMGAENITVYDDDKVEPHNLPNQFFRMKDVGKKKVVALAKIVKDFTGIEIKVIPERYNGGNLSGVVLITVDSMASRKIVWDNCYMHPAVKLYVDSRMGAQIYDIQSFRPTDKDAVKSYEATWYDDKDAIQERCSEKAIIYTVMAMANILCNIVKRHVQAESVPFHITGDCVTLMQNVEENPLEMEEPEEEQNQKASIGYARMTRDDNVMTSDNLRRAVSELTINRPSVTAWTDSTSQISL